MSVPSDNIKSELLSEIGVDVTVTAICKFLHKSGFTKQKAKMHAIQRDEALSSKFALDVSLYSREMLVFIDETGTDRRDCIRRRGYSLMGRTPIVQNFWLEESMCQQYVLCQLMVRLHVN